MKLINHLLFWLAMLVLLTVVFGSTSKSYTQSFLFVLMLLPVVAGTSYFFNYYLVPHYLLTKRLFRFFLFSVYMLIVSLYLEMVVVISALIFLANYHYAHMIPMASSVITIAIILYCIVFLYGFILQIRHSWVSHQAIEDLKEKNKKAEIDFITIRADRKTNRIAIENIDYLESLGDYVKIHLSSSQPIITKERISKLEAKLPDSFLRIHRSYIINIHKITSYTKEHIQIKDVNLSLSRTYKDAAIDLLDSQNRIPIK